MIISLVYKYEKSNKRFELATVGRVTRIVVWIKVKHICIIPPCSATYILTWYVLRHNKTVSKDWEQRNIIVLFLISDRYDVPLVHCVLIYCYVYLILTGDWNAL